MPVDQVVAGELRVGDVVRVDDPQAHRVERMLIAQGEVVLELSPVGLVAAESVRVRMPLDRIIDRLGNAQD